MSELVVPDAPYGWDVYTHTEVVPKLPPPVEPDITLRWHVLVQLKTSEPQPTGITRQPAAPHSQEMTVQLTADQQVALSISGEDRYDNPVNISGDVAWFSSDESIIVVTVDADDSSKCVAAAVGPVGTASVTVTNDVDQDGSGDFQGSLAIDVVAGSIAEVVIVEGEVSDKDTSEPEPEQPPQG